jgi:hypothetical protein
MVWLHRLIVYLDDTIMVLRAIYDGFGFDLKSKINTTVDPIVNSYENP